MLTDTTIRATKPRAKPYRLFDGGGLYLEVVPAGGKWWRFKYRFEGKEKRISLGVYPATGLRDARDKRDASRRLLAKGVDPSAARRAEKAAADDTVEAVAQEWYARHAPSWTPAHAERTMRRLSEVFPWIGARAVGEITAPELLAVLRRLEHRGTGNIAHRLHQDLGRVFQYAVATGRALRNPATDLEGALSPVQRAHYAAITEPLEVGALLRAIDKYHGSFVVQCALKLQALTFVRPGELRKAEWREIWFDAAQWCIPVERMKMKAPHIIPLASQSLSILRELCPLTGAGLYVFPAIGTSAKPMSENTVNAALRSMGYAKDKMTSHGFRSTARTLLDEVLGVRGEVIEMQLAHKVRGPLGDTYNRAKYLPERRKMMQKWGDYLDELKNGAEVVPIRGRL